MMAGRTLLRRLRDDEADYRLLEAWCRQEEIYRYFEQRVLSGEEIRKKYYPRTLEGARTPVFMIEREGSPVGIIQYQKISAEDSWCGIKEDGGYEIDLFIGAAEARGHGVGRKSVMLLAERLFEEKRARLLVMCPMKENEQAIRCYRKCGFEEKGVFSALDTIGEAQEYVRMVRYNPNRIDSENLQEIMSN